MKAHVTDLTAIFFAIFGFTCWVLGDTCIKWIGQFGVPPPLPPQEVVAFMGLFMALTLLLQAALRGNLGNLRPRSFARQGLRASLDMTNNVCVVIALRHLSLTMFYILIFTSPLVISALSAVFLGERLTPRKTLALLVGFCGVVVAVAPWSSATAHLSAATGHLSAATGHLSAATGHLSTATGALSAATAHLTAATASSSRNQQVDLIGLATCLVCVVCFSVNMVWSRVLTRTEFPESLAFCSGAATAAVGLALTSFHPRPLTPALWLALVAMGICCAAGTLSFYVAVKHTSASNVSQFHYTQLLTGGLVSYLVWREKPGVPMLVGGALILGSGIMIALAARNPQPAVITDIAIR